jgi:hypothetical protein
MKKLAKRFVERLAQSGRRIRGETGVEICEPIDSDIGGDSGAAIDRRIDRGIDRLSGGEIRGGIGEQIGGGH